MLNNKGKTSTNEKFKLKKKRAKDAKNKETQY